MKRIIIPITLCIFVLSGCYVPEKFNMNVILNKDKSYSIKCDGTYAHGSYVSAIRKYGDDASRAEQLKHMEENLILEAKKELEKKDSLYKKLDYKGNGRFEVQLIKEGNIDKKKISYIVPIFTQLQNGNILFMFDDASGEMQVSMNEFYKQGIKPTGIVSLKTDAKVIEHNATKTPGLFSSSYEWEIGEGKPLPRAIISLE